MRIILAVIMAMTLCATAGRARAQSAADKAAAEQLFQEGRALMQQERYGAAIIKFQASLDLDPGSGTQGNLALCYERTGKLTTAWIHYRETASRADREGNAGRARIARERAAALQPRLPRLQLRLPPAHAVAGLVIKRDGTPVPASVLGTAVYVDPGAHQVTATAPGYAPFELEVTLAEAENRTVEIPALVPLAGAQATTGAQATAGTGPALDAGKVDAPAPRRPRPGAPGRGQRLAGWVTGGAGLVALGVGLGVGATAISTWDDAFASGACNRDTLVCTPEGQEQTDTARGRARLSNILAGAGGAAVVIGALLYVTAPSARQERAAARLVPFTDTDTLGVAVVGGF
jgi:hypothetical protein